MENQNYANHRQFVPAFHYLLFPLLLLTLVGSGVNLYESWDDPIRIYSASLIVVLTLCVLVLCFLCRIFALKLIFYSMIVEVIRFQQVAVLKTA